MKTILGSGFIFSFFFLSGCATIDHHGHELSPQEVKSIEVGKTTRETLGKRFGTPSSVSPFDNSVWLYMSKTTSRRAFLPPSTITNSITRIKFDKKGVVEAIECLSETDGQIITHVSRKTPTSGYVFGPVEQVFSNVGNFGGKDPDMDRGQ